MQGIIANLIILLLLAAPGRGAAGQGVVRVATTTSTENSGLFDILQPAMEKALDIRMHVIAVGTGKALILARRGDVDVVLVHARDAEAAFVAAGYGSERHEVMYNDFIIVGPANDPAGIRNTPAAAAALGRIAATDSVFVSRGDDSGTHLKEQALWQQAGMAPTGVWYRQVGQGMAETLQIAAQMQAYTLVDRGTWLASRARTPLALLVEGGADLHNTYGLIAVNPLRFPDVNHADAKRLMDWFASEQAHALVSGYRVQGEQLFYPLPR